MTAPAITIITPVYNAARTVEATVRSVLAQSWTDFELILIDDGSKDESLSILLELANEDDRIRVVSQRNAGVAVTRNRGISYSKASLIAFLDADDLWNAEKLARHHQFHAANPDIGVSYARIAFVDSDATDNSKARTTSSIVPRALTIDDILAENPVCTMSNMVVTRACLDAVGGFLEGMSFAEDQEWLARAVDTGHRIEGLDVVLVDYRLSHDGLSVNLERMYVGWRKLSAAYRKPADRAAAEAVYCRYLSRRALRSGAPANRALRFAIRGLKLDASAFLSDTRRGWLTILSAFVAPLIPRATRIRIFA